MKVLLPIKPRFADLIFSEQKKYEYRRRIFKNDNIKRVVVYVTSPRCWIIGEFEIRSIIVDTPQEIWKQTSDAGGIPEGAFREYFRGAAFGYAIKIGKLFLFKRPKNPKEIIPNFHPPQSFMYMPK